jgi:hypothetical protein
VSSDTPREQFLSGQRPARADYRDFKLPSAPKDGTVADWDTWITDSCALLEGQYTLETVAGTTRRVHVLSATSDLVLIVEYDVTTLKFSPEPEQWFKENIGTAPAIPQ